MAFFNQKEEVIDIKLTQFGKNALSRGAFKPVYYRFFDDGILYNSENGYFSEHQNDTEKRILEETPRLKTQHMSYGVETQYFVDDEAIKNREKPRFEELRKNVNPDIQEKILKYAIGDQDITEVQSPSFSLRSMDAPLIEKEEVKYLDIDGITKKVPQLDLRPEFSLTSTLHSLDESTRITDEEHFDLTADKVMFKDGVEYSLEKQSIVIDIEELATFYGLENFDIEIYEVQKLSHIDEDSGEEEIKETLIKIEDLEALREKFIVKTDDDVEIEGKKTFKQRNFRREDEY